jgi:hypothetical protein
MKCNQSVKVLGSVVAGLIFSASAHSAMISCSDNPALNYMQMDDSQASACLDSGVGNLTGNPANDLFLNGAGSDYQFASKSDDSNPYNLTYGNGTWSFDSSFWDDYSDAALGFKFGTGNTPDEWFVFSLQDLVSSGEWAFFYGTDNANTTGGGLSHMNLYGKEGSVSVPEPGTIALLGLGLVGLTLTRRKKNAA